MTTKSPFAVPQRPEALQHPGLGGLAYWGDRKPPKDFTQVFNATKSSETSATKTRQVATLRLYGPIYDGWYGVSARVVSAALDELGDVDEIRVRINSPGGDAWEGMAILNMLRAHSADVVAVVDGIAASAASYVAAGCDRTVMSPGTQMMIHDASGIAFGPAEVMDKASKFLNSVSNSIASIYADIAGGTPEAWRALMLEETWYTAQEAVDSGLADDVAVVKDAGETDTAEDVPPEETVVIEVGDLFDLSIFNHTGRSHAPAPKPPSASAVGSPHTEGGSAVAFSDEQITTMRAKLQLPDTADEGAIVAAVEAVVEESLEEHPPADKPAIPEGHVVIPAAKLADLEAGAALATTTAKSLADKEREAFLDSVRGKYLPTNRAAWAKEFDRDPEATRAHFKDAPVLIPTSELGHDNPVDETKTEEDAVYAALFPDEQKVS